MNVEEVDKIMRKIAGNHLKKILTIRKKISDGLNDNNKTTNG